MNIAALLVVEDGADMDLATIRALLEGRLSRAPRLRQVLRPTPLGGGRPVWVDDTAFDVARHVSSGVADDDEDLLQAVADLACTRLPRDRPLWAARWFTGLGGGRGALVLVVHHVLTDGLGGLAVLAALGDSGSGSDPAGDGVVAGKGPPPGRWVPASPPSTREVVADARRARLETLRSLRPRGQAAIRGLRELHPGHRPLTLAAATSINRATGPRRRLSTVTVPLDEVVGAAHRHGCTVNDILLAAIGGALAGLLHRRGERPSELVISVPVSVRRSTTADRLGNDTGVAPVAVPTFVDPLARLSEVATRTRRRREAGSRGASAGPLGLAFRLLGRVGVFQVFIDHQRLVHTFVTNVRGPSVPLTLAGHRIREIVPVATTPGNVGVCFDVLSYAGTLGVTIVADPEIVPEQEALTGLVADEIAALTGPG
jgi:WS/DGAT/MGAT family acyltransferase